jgi:hypothetical protein
METGLSEGRGFPYSPREGIDDMLAIMMKMAKVVDKDGDPKYGLHAFRHFLLD